MKLKCDKPLSNFAFKFNLRRFITAIGESDLCNGFSGADLASLVREACVMAIRENVAAATAEEEKRETARLAGGAIAAAARVLPPLPPPLVTPAHFEEAFKRVQPSVSAGPSTSSRSALRGSTGSHHSRETTSVIPT